jgi:hypothetical protein
MGPCRFTICLAGLLSACGLLVGPASAACAFFVEWNGVSYGPVDTGRPVTFGPSLGHGVVPFCDDTDDGGCEPLRDESGESIAVFRLPGIDPHVAVGASAPWGRRVFLAAGFLPELPDHPFHGAIYSSPREPNERDGGWRCGKQIPHLVGTVTGTPALGLVFGVRFEGAIVRRDGGSTSVFVDASTSITGFDEFGVPRIEAGDRIRAAVRECTASGGRYKVVADSITPASA